MIRLVAVAEETEKHTGRSGSIGASLRTCDFPGKRADYTQGRGVVAVAN